MSSELKPGTSPLRIARVRSVEEVSDGRVQALKLEYKSKPNKNYTVVDHAPEEVTVVTKVEKIEKYTNAEPLASSVDNSPLHHLTTRMRLNVRLRQLCTGEPKWLLSQVSRG